ncbi:MAG TPA: type II CAAX endopeptidase family protein [Pyrinomonadaceae bacterium]|nr:type II CAAX endopeptidase family protein [Pyrinomonadaceae bacterium]
MFTEESSQQLTPLPEDERGEPAVIAPSVIPTPLPISPSTARWLAWLEVIKALGLWFMSVLVLAVVPVLVLAPYLIYRVATVGPSVVTPDALKADTMMLFYSVVGIIPAHLLTLYFAYLVVTEGGLRPFWKTVGWAWPKGTTPVTAVLLSGLIALVLYGLAWGVTTLYGGGKTELDMLIESSIYTRVATAFLAFATAPLVEEVVYRGVIYPAIEKVMGMSIAIAVVSMLFAGVHVWQYRNNLAVIVVITLLSITLTVARAVTGKLLPSFVIHLIFNGVQSVLIVLSGFIDKDLVK